MKNEIADIAVRSGKKIASVHKFTVANKGTRENLVTSMDIENERFLKNELLNLIPDSVFIGEEGDDNKILENGYTWIVDPIDGTTNYSRGIPEATVSIALLKNGKPCIGVVYNPFTDSLYTGEIGYGAEKNGKRIKVSDRSIEDSLLCTAWSAYDKSLSLQCFKVSERMHPLCNDIRRIGTAAGELSMLAEGAVDLYFEIRLMPWDHAAALVCVEAAGGAFCGIHGEKVSYSEGKAVLAANNVNNLKILSDIVNEEF